MSIADDRYFDFMDFRTMSMLHERLVKFGNCPKCHDKTLNDLDIDGSLDWYQCRKCKHVYVIDTSSDNE